MQQSKKPWTAIWFITVGAVFEFIGSTLPELSFMLWSGYASIVIGLIVLYCSKDNGTVDEPIDTPKSVAELQRELSRARTPDDCWAVIKSAPDGNGVQNDALRKLYEMLGADFAKAKTTDECLEVLYQTDDADEYAGFYNGVLLKAAALARTTKEAISMSDLEVDIDESKFDSDDTKLAILRAAELIQVDDPTFKERMVAANRTAFVQNLFS